MKWRPSEQHGLLSGNRETFFVTLVNAVIHSKLPIIAIINPDLFSENLEGDLFDFVNKLDKCVFWLFRSLILVLFDHLSGYKA